MSNKSIVPSTIQNKKHEVIAEIPGHMKIEKTTGMVNGKNVEVGKITRSGSEDSYSTRVNGKVVSSGVSSEQAKKDLKNEIEK